MWAFLSTLPMGTGGGSGASKLSKLEVSRGFLSLGLIGAGRVLLTMACQSSRLNHLCCLISVAPVGPDPSRLSGLTCSPRNCWFRVLGCGITHTWEGQGNTTRRAVRHDLKKLTIAASLPLVTAKLDMLLHVCTVHSGLTVLMECSSSSCSPPPPGPPDALEQDCR